MTTNTAPVITAEQISAWRSREDARTWDGTYTPLPCAWTGAQWFMWKAGVEPTGAWWALPYAEQVALRSEPLNNHFAHVSTVDGAMVAFTENDAKGVADRQTRMKPGKYLTKFFGHVLSAQQITDIATAFCAEFKPYDLNFADDADDIEDVYVNGPRSCMAYKANSYASPVHPVRTYAGPDLQVAWIGRGTEDVTARAVVWPDRKVYSTIYGDSGRLKPLLEKAGYSKGSLAGARLTLIETDDGDCVVPYVDCCSRGEMKGGYIVLGRGDIPLHETDGVAGLSRYTCAHCDRRVHEDDLYYCEDADESYCDGCYSELTFNCERLDRTFHRDNLVVMANGDHWSQTAFDRFGFTCPINDERYPDDQGVEMANGDTWSQDAFDTHGATCAATGALLDRKETVTLADGTIWAQEHFDQYGTTSDNGDLLRGPDAPADTVRYRCADTPDLFDAVTVRTIEPTEYVVMSLDAETPISVGDWVECSRTHSIPGEFTSGKRYQVTRVYMDCGEHRISVAADDSGGPNGWTASYFKRVDGPDVYARLSAQIDAQLNHALLYGTGVSLTTIQDVL